MRVIGVDFGTKRIGISVSDVNQIIASPLRVIVFENIKKLVEDIKNICGECNSNIVVIGYPYHMNGDKSDKCIIIDDIKQKLEETNISVFLQDERLTTVQAQKALVFADVKRNNRKKVVDKVASCLILQTFLDRRKNGKA